MPAIDIIQLRRGTAAAWTTANPVLADGELGVEKDTGKFKLGDGATHWVTLPYTLPGVQTSLTQVGAPTTGSHVVGETFIDSLGFTWACITAGTPGVWVPGASGLELAEAELSANPAAMTSSTADVAGLSITFTAPARPFIVEAYIPYTSMATAAPASSYVAFTVTDAANTVLCESFGQVGATNLALPPQSLRVRLPSIGTGGYAITPGSSYTFKVRSAFAGATSAQVQLLSGQTRPFIRAVTC